ncbi:MAG: cytochrome P450 [Dermatophilaceae bacterium]
MDATSAVPVRTEQADSLLNALLTTEGRKDPYRTYHQLRALGPVVVAPDGALVLTRYADCDALLRDPRFGRGDPDRLFMTMGLPDWREHIGIYQWSTSMLLINPPDHTRIRRLVSGAFTARRVMALRPAVVALTERLLDGLGQATGPVNFVDAFAFPLPIAVIGELLGIPAQDCAPFQGLVRDWTALLDVYDGDVLAQADRAAAQIRDYLAGLAAQRRREPREDLMTALVRAESAGDRLTEDELLTTAALLFAAGFETTTHLLGNALVALLDRPDQLPSLVEGADGVATAVEELLRFDSPVQISGRMALTNANVAGVPVAAGQRVVAYLGAANRDPGRFPDPDRLDLRRPGVAPLSFGGGIHYCLGAALARLEAQVALPALFARFPGIAIAGSTRRRDGLTLRGYLSLPVTTG